MSETMNERPVHRPHPGSMSEPYLELDLERELDELQRETAWATGRNARTLVKFDDLRVVLTAMKAGARIPAHQTQGRISIEGVRGRIRIRAEGRTFDLRPGSLLALDHGVSHEVEAIEDGAFLLTIAWPRPPAG
jgi:quercetin dioxygenase-like cupin family protein